MGVMIVEDERGARTQAFCDYCQQRIEQAQDGWYWWRIGTGRPSPMFLIHKACGPHFEVAAAQTDAAARVADAPFWGTMELRALPAYLAYNLGITPEASESFAQTMARMGL